MKKIDKIIDLLERLVVAVEGEKGVTTVCPKPTEALLTDKQIQQRREAFAKRFTTEKHGKDADKCGIHAEFAETEGNKLLERVMLRAQNAWITAFGAELIRKELPTAAAKWISDEKRSNRGELPLFLFHWFKNARERVSTQMAAPGSTGKVSAAVVSPTEIERTKRQIQQRESISYDRAVLEQIRKFNKGDQHG